MIAIQSINQRNYPSDNYGSSIVVKITLDESICNAREKQHLIEEKIDFFFNEIDEIMDASDHTG